MTRTKRPFGAVVFVVGSMLAACGSDDGGASGDAPTTSPPAVTTTAPATTTTTAPATTLPSVPAGLKVVTFNAGLARGFVDLAEQRAPLVAEALATLDADLVALQEVWEPQDVEAVQAATRDRFPEQVFLEPAPEAAQQPACEPGELDALESCIATACAGVLDEQLAACVLANCGADFGELGANCQTCLAANIGGSVDDILGACEEAADRYAYGGSFGIGLLSRHPITSTEQTTLESSLNRRAVLYARVDAGPLGEVHVFATHLSPVFSDIPYPGPGSWEEEQRAQIETLLGLIAEKAPPGTPVVVLGDLNTGPALAGIAGEAPDNFALLLAAGLLAPYVDQPGARCTFCADNPLVGGADDDESVLIDHVLVRDLEAVSVARVLDEPLTVGTVTAPLSDHYGVAVTLTTR
jgi:endonuclease/exonuclease/phosphatase family metal-dependent hydrolase